MTETARTAKAVEILYGKHGFQNLLSKCNARDPVVWVSFDGLIERLEPLLLRLNLFDCVLGALRICDVHYTRIIHTFHLSISEEARECVLSREGEDHLRGVPDDLKSFREGLLLAIADIPNSDWYVRLINLHTGSVELGYEAWRHLRRLAEQDVLVDLESSSTSDTWWRDRFRSVKKLIRNRIAIDAFVGQLTDLPSRSPGHLQKSRRGRPTHEA